MTTIRTSGVIVCVTLSLGYDVHHSQVEPLLVRAAEESGLEEPFVHILALGDFAVTYRVSGLLADVKRYITAHSNLYRCVLDELHSHDIEILSPSFTNRRQIAADKKVIPPLLQTSSRKDAVNAEDLVFDKAERAERVEREKLALAKDIEQLEAARKEADDEHKAQIEEKLALDRDLLEALERSEYGPDLAGDIVDPDPPADAD